MPRLWSALCAVLVRMWEWPSLHGVKSHEKKSNKCLQLLSKTSKPSLGPLRWSSWPELSDQWLLQWPYRHTDLTASAFWYKIGFTGSISFRADAFSSRLSFHQPRSGSLSRKWLSQTMKSYKIFTEEERSFHVCAEPDFKETIISWRQWPKLFLLRLFFFQHNWARALWHLVF